MFNSFVFLIYIGTITIFNLFLFWLYTRSLKKICKLKSQIKENKQKNTLTDEEASKYLDALLHN